MTDLELIDYVAAAIESFPIATQWQYVALQKQQPTQQGVPLTPVIWLERLFDRHYGPPVPTLTYNATTGLYDEVETQIVETTLQISTTVPQNPEDLTLPTAADVANQVKMYLASVHNMRLFAADGLAFYRVSDVRAQWFNNDQDRNENNPNFDFVIQHHRAANWTVPAAIKAEERLIKGF